MRFIFDALIDEYQKSGPASAAMMEALMNQCLIEVLRAAEAQADGSLPWLSALDDPRISKVIDAILDRPENSYTVETLANIAAMSRATFVRHFEKCFDRTPMDYLRDVRLRRAAQLLQVSGVPVEGCRGQGRVFQSQSLFAGVPRPVRRVACGVSQAVSRALSSMAEYSRPDVNRPCRRRFRPPLACAALVPSAHRAP